MLTFFLLLIATSGGALIGSIVMRHLAMGELDHQEAWYRKRHDSGELEKRNLRREVDHLQRESAEKAALLDQGVGRVVLALGVLEDQDVVEGGLSPWGVAEVKRFLVGIGELDG